MYCADLIDTLADVVKKSYGSDEGIASVRLPPESTAWKPKLTALSGVGCCNAALWLHIE